jgi:expansin (peptidoglycan-binding protein)
MAGDARPGDAGKEDFAETTVSVGADKSFPRNHWQGKFGGFARPCGQGFLAGAR